MKKITREDVYKITWDDTLDHIKELQELCEIVAPITRSQAPTVAPTVQDFQPDWSKAPEWAQTWVGLFSRYDERTFKEMNRSSNQYFEDFPPTFIPRPLPPKVPRARTTRQLLHLMVEHHYHESELEEAGALENIAMELAGGKTLSDLCTAAGISLTEEV